MNNWSRAEVVDYMADMALMLIALLLIVWVLDMTRWMLGLAWAVTQDLWAELKRWLTGRERPGPDPEPSYVKELVDGFEHW